MMKYKFEFLKNHFDQSDRVSIRSASYKFHIYKSYVHKILQKKSNIKYNKKGIIPKRTLLQIEAAKSKCSRLYRKF